MSVMSAGAGGSCWGSGRKMGSSKASQSTAGREKGMTNGAKRTNKVYAVLQTILLCIFTAAVFFAPGERLLLAGKIPRVVGNALSFAGLLLLFGGIKSLGRAIQVNPEPRPDATLVTSGIYKWFRHPIYTAIVIIVAGMFLRRSSPIIGLAALI